MNSKPSKSSSADETAYTSGPWANLAVTCDRSPACPLVSASGSGTDAIDKRLLSVARPGPANS
jgi:hypothetical protein